LDVVFRYNVYWPTASLYKYLGGTVDVTVHQYEKKDSLKEIYRVSGGDMGGLQVNQLFEDHLEKLFSKDNIKQIKNQAYDEWMTLQADFERGKKIIVGGAMQNTISIGTSKQCPWQRNHFNSIPIKLKEGVELKKNGRLVISTSIIKDMIRKVACSIRNHVAGILSEIDITSLDAILMVGGFSNSVIVFEEMKKLVNDEVPVIVPGNAELSIVMGAVLFGWKSNVIRTRKSRMTYGISVYKPFIEGYHDYNRSYVNRDGERYCKDCFQKLVTINEDVEVYQQIQLFSSHTFGGATHSSIPLRATTAENPKYKDDEGVQKIGEILIPKTKESRGKDMITSFYFGDTEIKMKVFDEATGKTYEKEIDFLYDNCVKFEE